MKEQSEYMFGDVYIHILGFMYSSYDTVFWLLYLKWVPKLLPHYFLVYPLGVPGEKTWSKMASNDLKSALMGQVF